MNKKIKNLIALAISQLSLIFPLQALAQQNQIVPETLRPINNVVKIVQAIVQFILVVAFVLAFIFLLIGGIRWITAGGDEKGVAAARGMITAALIGLVIVLVAFAIIRLVEIFFGVNIVSNGVTIPVVNTT